MYPRGKTEFKANLETFKRITMVLEREPEKKYAEHLRETKYLKNKLAKMKSDYQDNYDIIKANFESIPEKEKQLKKLEAEIQAEEKRIEPLLLEKDKEIELAKKNALDYKGIANAQIVTLYEVIDNWEQEIKNPKK